MIEDVVCVVDDEEKWHCFICSPEPLSELVQTCSQFIRQHHVLSYRDGRGAKRRRSASSMVDMPKKLQTSPAATPATVTPPPQKKPASVKSRFGISPSPKVSPQVAGSPKLVDNGGVVMIHRPKYAADMIPVTEHNVWPVLEKLLAATQSMSMLLGSLKDDLQRTSALAAKAADFMVAGNNPTADIAVKKREAAMKLWRAFDAYQKSFVDIEAFSRDTSKTVKNSDVGSSSTA